jgi:serine/threonine-protein kinase
MTMLTPGAIVAGRYRIERSLGEGGMGVVYEATQIATQRRVALKVILPRWASKQDIRTRFVQEAQVTSRIPRCQHIVDVVDAGVDELLCMPFMAMELLDGSPLSALVPAKPMEPELVRELFVQLGEALDLAHGAGVIHRDIKPANLFLTRDHKGTAVLKIVDFGIARVLDAGDARHGTQIGTPGYAAPEQLGAKFADLAADQGVEISRNVSCATDIWPLGIIAFELLTGISVVRFWGADTVVELPLQVCMHTAGKATARAGDRAPLLPPGFDQWCAQCLERDARRRWSSAGEACNRLAGLLTMGLDRRADTEPAGPVAGALAMPPVAPTIDATDVMRQAAPLDSARTVEQSPAAGALIESKTGSNHTDMNRIALVFLGVGAGALCIAIVVNALRQHGNADDPGPFVLESSSPDSGGTLAPPSARKKRAPKAQTSATPVPGRGPAMVAIDGSSCSLPAFSIDATEVTVRQYTGCVEDHGCQARTTHVFRAQTSETQLADLCNWNRGAQRLNHPVNCVKFVDAEAFCRWAGKRLPSESEWNCAARDAPSADWRSDGGTREVQASAKTANGIADLRGNVAEWVVCDLCPHGKWMVFGGDWAGIRKPFPVTDPETHTPTIGFRCASSP